MESYTRSEKIDMIVIYGECLKNSVAAARLYADRYPGRRHPTRHYFPKLEEKLRTEPNNEIDHHIVSEDKEIDVLALVEVNPTMSIRELGDECGVSHTSVLRILQKYKYHSYKYQLHQHLYEDDSRRRLAYCNWYLGKYAENNVFPSQILYTDESRFTNNGMFNRQNKRYWSKENMNLMEQGNFQEQFGFNCWMGILGDKVVGPIFFYGHLTGERYLEFLRGEIENFLDDIPLLVRNNVLFQQDGAPPHNYGLVREFLTEKYGDNWIGTNGPVRWPPRSPDLTPLDFYLWGKIKNEVYDTRPTTLDELKNKVRAALNNISQQELRRVVGATVRRIQLCVAQNGGHFEQLM